MRTLTGRKNRFAPFVGVVALFGLSIFGVGETSASADASRVPLKASVNATVSLTGETTFELNGTVIGSHLGSGDYQAAGRFTGPNTDTLTETLVAANGDTITIQCDQVLDEIDPGIFYGRDTWFVVGGTGRFSGAIGSGTGETYVDLNTGNVTKQLTGTISAPGTN